MSSISTLRRQVKNVARNYTDAQVKVREATSNDPWGPTTVLMSEIAELTHNPVSFTEIMTMIWKRLNDHGKNWRHVYKSLVLLDYLIKCGSEKVAAQCRENIFSIETLKDFQHIEENRDQGLNVRTKAKQMVSLLQDEEKLKNERARFMLTRKRFMQNGSSGISSDGTRRTIGRRPIDSGVSDPEFEEARPSSLGEEEMQLQIALALSKEECEKEQELRRGDDIRLQIAIEESRREMVARSSSLSSPAGGIDASQKPSTSKSQGALDDLLALGLDDIFNQQTSDPSVIGAVPGTSASSSVQTQQLIAAPFSNDPWSPRPSTTIPMVGTSIVTDPEFSSQQSANNDPWAAFDTQNSVETGQGTAQMGEYNGTSVAKSAGLGQQRSNVKTPESFLGENSALVNLDNLLGPSTTAQNNAPKRATTNPFLIGTSAALATNNKNNPFLANERPSPSLNEMVQAKGGGSVNSQQPAAAPNGTATTSSAQHNPFGPDGSLI